MAVAGDTFSMSTLFDALPNPNGISGSVPPPGFAPRASATHLHAAMFNLMTCCDGMSSFKEMIASFDKTELQRMASLLTSDSDYFMAIVTNKHGSRRVQKLLGKSDDVDALFCDVILRRFLHITTDKYASYVTIRAMAVFDDKEMKKAMYEQILYYALYLARDQHGCIALNDIITDADDPYYKDQILDLVAYNALCLSNDASGNFVVQRVLALKDLRTMHNIAVSLRGHCFELSFKKYGSYIVEKLLEAESSMVVVVVELLECDGDRLMRLARNEYGNFVVCNALKSTKMSRIDLFWCLVQKLMPFIHLLRRSHGSNIANILESVKLRY
ncbi:PREDICTED: pumilio homolog 18-like [Camelina sativa]|uniref:Pumilio homolog 18-like n=1 Tax=Camelina sativa TaxID=90675 RepID=A0ABM0VGX4_CAMSA|nr:PREDICTED: pumilio homolog 18-like [Camelina sativa]